MTSSKPQVDVDIEIWTCNPPWSPASKSRGQGGVNKATRLYPSERRWTFPFDDDPCRWIRDCQRMAKGGGHDGVSSSIMSPRARVERQRDQGFFRSFFRSWRRPTILDKQRSLPTSSSSFMLITTMRYDSMRCNIIVSVYLTTFPL